MGAVDPAFKNESPSALETDLKEAVIWVEANKTIIPSGVYRAVILLTSLRAELESTKARATRLLDLFRRELGVTPKSERGKPPPEPKPPKDDEDRLKDLKKRRQNLSKEIRGLGFCELGACMGEL